MKRLAVLLIIAVLFCGLFGCGGDGAGGGSSHINLVLTQWAPFTKYGDWAARGAITNRGSDRALYVKVLVDLYDAGGTIIGSDYTYVDSADASISPCQTVTFTLWAYGIKPSQVATVKGKIVWRDDDFDQGQKTF